MHRITNNSISSSTSLPLIHHTSTHIIHTHIKIKCNHVLRMQAHLVCVSAATSCCVSAATSCMCVSSHIVYVCQEPHRVCHVRMQPHLVCVIHHAAMHIVYVICHKMCVMHHASTHIIRIYICVPILLSVTLQHRHDQI